MNTSKKVIATLVTTVIGLAGVSGVIAATQNESDRSEQGEQLEALKAKVSLSEAIIAAEKATGGRAVEASWDNEDGQQAYEVETIATDGSETEVKISAADGSVISKAEANDGDEDGNDERHEKQPKPNRS